MRMGSRMANNKPCQVTPCSRVGRAKSASTSTMVEFNERRSRCESNKLSFSQPPLEYVARGGSGPRELDPYFSTFPPVILVGTENGKALRTSDRTPPNELVVSS